MNAKRKEAAIKAHLQTFQNATSEEEVLAAIKADAKNYTEDEIAEILEALPAAAVQKEQGANKPEPARKYEKWRVRFGEDGTMKKVEPLDQDGEGNAVARTLELRHVETLNAQARNSNEYYYEA
jgi:hypothetical protein